MAPDEEFEADDLVWIGIIAPETGRHCGFIYRTDTDLRMLHLGFHKFLLKNEYRRDYWWSSFGLEDESQAALAAILASIASNDPPYPYAPAIGGIQLEKETGHAINVEPGTGLTCATFVLAVLETHGYRPIRRETWPIREEDDRWKETILARMEEYGVDQAHIAAVRDHPASARFRPEEVVGCASSGPGWEIEYEEAVKLAQEVLADMGVAA